MCGGYGFLQMAPFVRGMVNTSMLFLTDGLFHAGRSFLFFPLKSDLFEGIFDSRFLVLEWMKFLSCYQNLGWCR